MSNMILALQALGYVDVNHFSVVERLDLIQGNGGTYHIQLIRYEDSIVAPGSPGLFAQRQLVTNAVRYVPAVGATVQIAFVRTLSIVATPANQDVVVTLTADANDRSIYSFVLTPANVDKIISEGVKLIITESGLAKTYPVDHFVRRRSNMPGA